MTRKTPTPRLSKKQKRILDQNKASEQAVKLNFSLKHISPLTTNQKATFDAFAAQKNLLLHGFAGTGKSFVALYLSLSEMLYHNDKYQKVIIVRSIVPTRDIGFLPGSIDEKISVYEDPYRAIFSELFERADAYDYLKEKGLVEFRPTSFVRGATFNDCIVIVDESQNCDWGELSSVMTRAGNNCRMIFCGDRMQSDFRHKERNAKDDVLTFMNILSRMPEDFCFVEFLAEDIVRSKLVKRFIIESSKSGMAIS